jgi:hypothetical protein
MADRDGARGIVAAALPAIGEALKANEAPVQENLFDIPATPVLFPDNVPTVAHHAFPNSVPLTSEEIAADTEQRRKGGRPPGAQNIATRQIREYLLKKGVVPQKWMMDWLLVSPEELAARLRCSIGEAFDKQVSLAKELGRYIMAPMATVDDKGNAVPTLAMVFGNQILTPGDNTAGISPPWQDEPVEIEALEVANDG